MNVISTSLFGYNKAQTEQLIEEYKSKINALEQQVTTLESSLDEYKQLDATLRDSIVDARAKGNNIIEDSHMKANQVIDVTNKQVEEFKSEVSQQGYHLVQSGKDLQDRLVVMKEDIQSILTEFETFLNNTQVDHLFPEDLAEKFDLQMEEFNARELMEMHQTTKKAQDALTLEEQEGLHSIIREVVANKESDDEERVAQDDDDEEQEHQPVSLQVINK